MIKHFTVFYIELSDEQTAAVNAKGWAGTEEGLAYLDATLGKPCNPDKAMKLGLYEKAAVFNIEKARTDMDADEAFDYVWSFLQNTDRGSWSDGEIVGGGKSNLIECHTERPRSMMVGDIIYDHMSDRWAVTRSIGFEAVDQDLAAEFLAPLL